MSYIGKEPQVGAYNMLDALTASATASYSLTLDSTAFVPESANHLLVSLNGVIQKAGSSFTVSGSTLTFSSALTSSDSIDFVLALGNVLDIGTPSDNTVSLAKLTATGTKDATTFLRGDNTFATAGGDADNYFATSGLSSKDLGAGLHIKTGDTGATVSSEADELVIEHGSSIGGMTILGATDGLSKIAFGDSGNNDAGMIHYSHDGTHMAFTTEGSERMRINGNGTIAVGHTGSAGNSITGAGANGVYLSPSSSNGANCIAMSGDQPLTVNRSDTDNSDKNLIGFHRNGSTCGTISGTNSSTSYNTSSDYRLKENKVAISDGIDRVKQLKPYRFNFKADADKTVDGFFAHEVTPVVPEAISGEKDAVDSEGNIIAQGIDQSKLVPLLTSALQEAIEKIETLEAKVEALENA